MESRILSLHNRKAILYPLVIETKEQLKIGKAYRRHVDNNAVASEIVGVGITETRAPGI